MAAKKRKKKSIAPKIILAAFVIYAAWAIISNQVKANRFNQDTAKNEEIILTESMKKERLEQELAAEIDDEYVEREAQNQGYAAPNERVFVDIKGN